MIKLSFGQNDCPIRGSFWLKDSLITHILFELCLFRYLAQSTYFRDTLYVKEIIFKNLTGCKERQSLAFIIVWP